MIREWLEQNLVCPRDYSPLRVEHPTRVEHPHSLQRRQRTGGPPIPPCKDGIERGPLSEQREGSTLVCAHGHAYPVVDGIPIMLRDEADPTHWGASLSLLFAESESASPTLELRGRYVRLARQLAGLTVADLAEGFGGSVQQWERIEGEERDPATGRPLAVPTGVSDAVWNFVLQTLRQYRNEQCRTETAGSAVDPHVQASVAKTSGHLYTPLVGKLIEYPIPELRLPHASGEMLLDIGCNWGRWSVSAARKGYTVVGIDPNIEGLLAARRVCRQLGMEATFVAADARSLPFAPGSFSVVFSYSVLQHLSRENARLALAEAARVLRPSGTSLIQMPNAFGVRSFFHQVKRRFREGQGFEVRYWTPAELRRVFETIIGPSRLSVDGFFGLGIQPSDLHLLPRRFQIIVRCSEALRRLSLKLPGMHALADSLYVTSVREPSPESAASRSRTGRGERAVVSR